RTLIEQVRIIPQVGRYSVFIIDEVHMLSAAAFNAFLKTLEEPPAHAIFILATTEKHKIIPTILSRCQIYDFNRIRVEDGVEYLKYIASQEGIAADEESLNLIAQKADGGMREALSMFDKAVSFCGTTLDYRNVARTLNVLDYDTYFHVTEQLLAGYYSGVLVEFDEVLSKGFSGQTFMAGLNRHMRDLLMAKRPETLRLIEMTGTLLERYRTQAGACEVEFLFGAISVLTGLDGKIRQSSNQRLLVELGLMKIAGLGQKKNESIADSEAYPLPSLSPHAESAGPDSRPATTAAATVPVAEPAPVSVPAEPTPATAEPSSVEPAPATPQPAASEPVASVAPAPTVESPARVASPAPVAPAKPAPAAASRPRSLISGTSLSELLATAETPHAEGASTADATSESATEPEIDPACAAKLEQARPQLMQLVRERRPRFVQVFEEMRLHDNAIAISVPTTELRDEILRMRTSMLSQFAKIAGVNGKIELEITVNEQIRAARPIKLEDRVKHSTETNTLVNELLKALDSEIE
ncbi:MAG: DNA polymerase III subunit gamma/tau, partial [Alistipes sp.]|nr:DNA polymerase III subunit gamma/tau [Alistipes sp.]